MLSLLVILIIFKIVQEVTVETQVLHVLNLAVRVLGVEFYYSHDKNLALLPFS